MLTTFQAERSPSRPHALMGFIPFQLESPAQEAADRRARILGLPAERVVAFHPVGFPGRPSRLESSVVIVDDVWAMVGSSTFRRRGLTFDGGIFFLMIRLHPSSTLFPDTALFRRRL